MRSLIAFAFLAVFAHASGRARAEECFDIVEVAAHTSTDGVTNCSATYGGWGIGLPTPWGTVGFVKNPTTVTTQCEIAVTFTPTHHEARPGGRYRVTQTFVHGWTKTYTGCHSAGSAAVCDYSTTPTDVADFSAGALCGGEPPKT